VIRTLARVTCTLACLCATAVGADTLVIPPSFENVCATGTRAFQPFPFATTPSFNYPYRYQQVYDANAFPAVGPGESILISEIRFRIDEYSGGLEQITYSDITVNFSTTSRAVGALATGSTQDLDSNLGPDQMTAFSGGFLWDACGTPDTCVAHICGPDFSPMPFDQAIPLSQSFSYDPTQGNLLLEVYALDPTPPNQLFDAADVPFPITTRARETLDPANPTIHYWPTAANDVGLITQFVYTVPEADALLGPAAAMLALGAVRRARR